MNSIERVTSAMEFKPIDRPPIFPVITFMHASRITKTKIADIILNPNLAYETLYQAWKTYGFDGFEVPALDEFVVFSEKLTSKIVDGMLFLYDVSGEPRYKIADEEDLEIPVYNLQTALKDICNTEYLTAEKLMANGYMDGVRQLIKKINGRAFIIGHAPGQTMNSLVKLRGSENAIFDLMDSPKLVHQAMKHFTLKTIELGKAYAEVGVNGIYIGDAWASASVISPNIFQTFCAPYYKMAADAFHKLGLKVLLHICGNSTPLLEHMAATGVDSIEPLDPLGGVSLDEAKQRVGKKVCLKGGVSTLTLLNGTTEQVRAETRQCLSIFSQPTGYIFGTGDDIPRDAPIENVLAMCDEVKKFKY